jgi:hypothetical protein
MQVEKLSYDIEQIRDRITVKALYEKELGPLRRSGSNWTGRCPFHEEKTGSFSIRVGDEGRAKCFGCGWNGDIFDFWGGLRNVDFAEAARQLGGLTGVSPRVAGVAFSPTPRPRPSRGHGPDGSEEWTRALIPPLDLPTRAELEMLATSRGLQVPGLERAAEAGRLRCCDWPQFYRRSQWEKADVTHRSWCVTDKDGWVAEYRRLDGQKYTQTKAGEEPRQIKSWSTKNKAWPLGAGEVAKGSRVILVEGGADMLAGYHFLWGMGVHGVTVVAMLGASNRIASQALGHFAGARVKIVMDADEARTNERTGKAKAPGMEAAARWQDQLTTAGAIVGVYSLYGLETAKGKAVKDLNDLAMASAATIASDEVWGLFFDWDF